MWQQMLASVGLPFERRPRLAGVPELSPQQAAVRLGRRRVAAAGAARGLLLFLLLTIFAAGLHLRPSLSSTSHHLPSQSGPARGSSRRLNLAAADNAVLLARAATRRGGAPSQARNAASFGAGTGGKQPRSGSGDQTLSFPVCGGYATQRIALAAGAILAAELDRTLVLPRLVRDASQPPTSGNTAPFGDLLDAEAFAKAMAAHGVRVAPEPPPAADAVSVRLSEQYGGAAALGPPYAHVQHLWLDDCPAFQVMPDLVVQHEQLVFAALDALQPTQPLQDIVHRAQQHLQGLSSAQVYNLLHLKTEEDWILHCTRAAPAVEDGGMALDNCLNNTGTVGDQLEMHHVDTQAPLLLLVGPGKVRRGLVQEALKSLKARGFQVLQREDVLRSLKLPALAADQAALVDYQLALGCRQFIGNSVSVFSALLIMERWHAGRWATYYNGGNVPLEAFLPLFPMPWVFTYNDWSSGTEYDQMVKVAVTSGIQVARMKPFCMFGGSTDSEMYRWLQGQNVTIIQHEPAWKEALAEEGRRHREEYSKKYSHLYRTDGALVGAFQRIDLPLLHEFDQYNFVLFTDCDVYFRRQMRLVDWDTPLPTALGLGFENEDKFPYNDGVMLWNMPYMRKTNKAFVDWILAQRNGLYFYGYGPVDQGAFNQFYEKEIRGKPINKNFNTKIYHKFRPQARIVHLHGPKLRQYLTFFETGDCDIFKVLCQQGFDAGLCQYVEEYSQLAPGWEVARNLSNLCRNLNHGTWHLPWA